jgi:hypothetical protein
MQDISQQDSVDWTGNKFHAEFPRVGYLSPAHYAAGGFKPRNDIVDKLNAPRG